MAQINAPKPLIKEVEPESEYVATTAYVRSVGFFDEHKQLIIGIGVAILLVVAAFGAYRWWMGQQADEADVLLGAALPAYESGQFDNALDGTDGAPGLLAIADDYGSTDAGNLAHYYAADALYRLGRYDEALEHFEAFDGDGLFGASAVAGAAAVYEARGEYAEAAERYERAARYDNPVTAPDYLLAAARNYEAAGDLNEAVGALNAIEADYADTPAARDLEMLRARLEALMAD